MKLLVSWRMIFSSNPCRGPHHETIIPITTMLAGMFYPRVPLLFNNSYPILTVKKIAIPPPHSY